MRIILVFFFVPHIRLTVIRTTHRQTRTHTHKTFGSTNKLKFRNVRKNARVSLATFVAETIGRHRTQLTLLAAAATARKLQQFAVIAASTHATWSTLTHRGRRSVIVCVNRKLIAAKVASSVSLAFCVFLAWTLSTYRVAYRDNSFNWASGCQTGRYPTKWV